MSESERPNYLMRLNITLDLDNEIERLVAEYHARLPDGIKVHFFKMLMLEAMNVPADELDLKFGRLVRAYGNKDLNKGRGRGRRRFDLTGFQASQSAPPSNGGRGVDRREVAPPQTKADHASARQQQETTSPPTPVAVQPAAGVAAGLVADVASLAGGKGWNQ